MSESPVDGPPLIYQIVFPIFILVLGGLAWLVSFDIVTYLGFNGGKDFIGAMWRLVFFGLLLVVLPTALATEIMWARMKKRRLRLLSTVSIALLMLEDCVVVAATGFALEVLFPELSFTNEPFTGMMGLALGLLVALPLLAVALTYRIKRIHSYVRKAFE